MDRGSWRVCLIARSGLSQSQLWCRKVCLGVWCANKGGLSTHVRNCKDAQLAVNLR